MSILSSGQLYFIHFYGGLCDYNLSVDLLLLLLGKSSNLG